MTGVVDMSRSVPCKRPNAPRSPTSWEKMLDVLDYLNTVVEAGVLVEFSIKRLAPGLPSRNAEHVAVARALGVSRNTVENWRNEATKCSMPLRLAVAVGRTFLAPDEIIAAFSAFTGEDHAQHFEWLGAAQ